MQHRTALSPTSLAVHRRLLFIICLFVIDISLHASSSIRSSSNSSTTRQSDHIQTQFQRIQTLQPYPTQTHSNWTELTSTGDAMTRLQADLDETKIILHSTISAVLQRGEKLDDLVAKSEDLSSQSKMFYKTARKTNQCCSLIPWVGFIYPTIEVLGAIGFVCSKFASFDEWMPLYPLNSFNSFISFIRWISSRSATWRFWSTSLHLVGML